VAPFPGILTETMIRGHSFALFEIGRRLERAFGLSATLRAHMCTLRKRIGRHLTPFLSV
jgi:uncharacterized alpha-E superfamily protein